MTDRPIDEHDYLYGANVVQIGEIRVARGRSRVAKRCCDHRRIVYDNVERRVWCENCESEMEAFDAFESLVKQHDSAQKHYENLIAKHTELAESKLHRIAAKQIEKEWQKKRTLPACPSCYQALFPDDFIDGAKSRVSKELATAKRTR